jgi:hypothetical protein
LKDKTYPVLTAVSLMLYSILNYIKEIVEKNIIAGLYIAKVDFEHDTFQLATSFADTILIAIALVCAAISISSFFLNRKNRN